MVFLLHGSLSFALVDHGSRRQSTAAPSTAHSEIGAVKDCWQRSLLPIAGAWEQIVGRPIQIRHKIDCDAARKAIQKGLSITLRYMRKSSRISLASLHDMSQGMILDRVDSKDNKSDTSTKPMDQETLTRHLFSIGYYAAEWNRTGRKHKEYGVAMTAIANQIVYSLYSGLSGGIVTGPGRSV